MLRVRFGSFILTTHRSEMPM